MSGSPLKCLVTGGAGFIGSHVAEHLVRGGHQVRVVDNLSTGDRANLAVLGDRAEFVEGDLTDPALCARVVRGVEVVWHLAALPSVPRSMLDPRGCHEHNVNATVNLLLAAREAGVRRLIYSSSSSIYGDTPVLPKVETVEPLPRSPYAAAKLAGEQSVLAFARAGMIEGVALRYFNVFGSRQSPTSAYAAVIPAWLSASAQGVPARVYGDGLQTRDFTYIDNVVAANLAAATLPPERVSGWVVNIGSGTRTTLLQLAELIGEVTGRGLVTEFAPIRPGDVKDSLASLERATRVLGYRVLVPLREGLKRTWEWISATQ